MEWGYEDYERESDYEDFYGPEDLPVEPGRPGRSEPWTLQSTLQQGQLLGQQEALCFFGRLRCVGAAIPSEIICLRFLREVMLPRLRLQQDLSLSVPAMRLAQAAHAALAAARDAQGSWWVAFECLHKWFARRAAARQARVAAADAALAADDANAAAVRAQCAPPSLLPSPPRSHES